MPQLNAAGTRSILDYAIANSFGGYMQTFKADLAAGGPDATPGGLPLSTVDRQDIVDYFATVLATSFPLAKTVAYNTATTIPLKLDSTLGEYTSVNYSGVSAGNSVVNGTAVPYTSFQGSSLNERTALYTPGAATCTTDSFTATATGPGGTSTARTVNITITAPAAPDLSTTATTKTATFNTATNIPITNTGGVIGSISIITPLNQGGNLVVNGTSSFTYTSSATAWVGTETFTYRADGPCGLNSSNVTVTITIPAPPATAPNFTTTAPYNATGAAAPTVISVAGTTANVITSAAVIGAASHGTAVASGTNIQYTPGVANLTDATISYQTSGPGTSPSSTGTITVQITPPGAPVVSTPNTVNVPYNAGAAAATNIPLAGYITGLAASTAITTPVGSGTATVNGATSIDYTPAVGNLTATSLVYRVSAPGGAQSNFATLNITFAAPGAPAANNRAVSTPFNTPATFDLASSITGTLGLTTPVTLGATSNGGVANVAGTSVTYTPAPGYSGVETFTYTAFAPPGSPTGASSTATVTMTVIALPVVANVTTTVPFNTATAITLPVTGSTQINITSAPSHGTAPTPAANTTAVLYTPTTGYSGTDSFSYTATGPGGTSAVSTVSITVSTLVPTAAAAAMTVPLNTATTLDLAPYITGSSITGVEITANPAHGTVTVNGTKVTFTPVNNYFGADAFSYRAYGNAGTSASAVVSVTVIGRPDPTKDPNVTGLITAQGETARRFARAQISNFQSRMESLHRRNDPPEAENSGTGSGASTSYAEPRPTTPAEVVAKGYVRDTAPAAQANRQPGGAAYRPAARLNGDPAAGLMPAQPTGAGAALAAVTAALTGGAKPSDTSSLLGKAVDIAATAAQSSTLNLAASSGDGSTSSVGDVDIWAGGSVRFGSRDAGTATGATFSSDGVSFGADKRISDQLAVGVGFGFARDRTDIGTDGTMSNSKSTTIAVYGSYQPMPNIFIDGLLGYGTLSYDTNRFVVPISQFASSKRSGDFLFASLAAGYEFRRTGLLVSPYGRFDVASHRLNDVTETGAGLYALHYYNQRIPSVQAALGLRFESAHETGFGYVMPRLRVEYQHDFKGEQAAAISYADQIGGTVYTVPAISTSRNSVVVGVGSDFVFGGGLRLAIDYQTQRASATDTSQAIFFKLVKDLDGRTPKIPTYAMGSQGFGVNFDAGVTYDDNVTRSSASATRLFDTVYSFNVSKPFTISLADNWRIGLNVFAGAEKFKTYSGLDRIFGGAEAALQYRESGEFGSPIYSLFANFAGDEYNSDLRDGKRLSLGVSMRKAFTDRISMYAAMAKNSRYAHSDVFNTRDYSARVNVDYSITPESTLYLTGEYRRGDIVSTGDHTVGNVNVARVFNRDDAFTRQGLYAYRADGRTVLLTLGYNLPLGTHDSLDFSVRRAFSEASLDSNTGAGKPRYFANQFSIIYLTSF
jgi:uncharacterized protein YhjY with autotransporter beta-barrel domain